MTEITQCPKLYYCEKYSAICYSGECGNAPQITKWEYDCAEKERFSIDSSTPLPPACIYTHTLTLDSGAKIYPILELFGKNCTSIKKKYEAKNQGKEK